jgi:hypothetical protein
MDHVSSTFISNFISKKVTERYGMDSSQTIFMSTIIGTFLSQFEIIPFLTMCKIYLILPIIILCCYYFPYKRFKVGKPEKKYVVTRVFDTSKYAPVRFMMNTHPEFWAKGYDMEMNNPFFPSISEYFIPAENVDVHFDDTIHNVKGYITIRRVQPPPEQLRDDKSVKSVRCMELSLEEGSVDGSMYLNMLENYRISTTKANSTMQLYMTKILRVPKTLSAGDMCHNHTVLMYEGPSDSQEKRYKDYMLSYFSEHRDKLWKYFSNIHFHPEKFRAFGQEARANMLLYGPPGTGKSAFAYRLAMSLGRHIVSLDITCLDKADVYQIMQQPTIAGLARKPDECIFLLEEFDITVMYLNNKRKKKMSSSCDQKKHEGSSGPKGLEEVKTEAANAEDFSQLRSAREFELEDLLEILQGPVPIPGSIIIATSNKYKEMVEICPALFRAGRLTPVEFGNMTWNSLQEMTKHYFGKELNISPVEKMNLATSEIIENALSCSLYEEKGFAMFEAFLKSKISLN